MGAHSPRAIALGYGVRAFQAGRLPSFVSRGDRFPAGIAVSISFARCVTKLTILTFPPHTEQISGLASYMRAMSGAKGQRDFVNLF